MTIALANAQRGVPVDVPRLTRLARCAVRALRIRTLGRLEITFVAAQQMRRLNRRFLRQDRSTDVLSFRYLAASAASTEISLIVGDIVIAPREAHAYAKRHRLPYAEELSRYVIHGLLHWLGHEDRTSSEQRKMRMMENRLLIQCLNGPARAV